MRSLELLNAPLVTTRPPRPRVEFFVEGEPRGMGSKTAFVVRSKATGKMRAVITDKPARGPNEKKLPAWQKAVHAEASKFATLGDVAIAVSVEFLLPRPVSHMGTGRNAGILRSTAPMRPAVKPDLDKLVRSTCDALASSGLVVEDSRIVRCTAVKSYALPGKPTGALILVEALP